MQTDDMLLFQSSLIYPAQQFGRLDKLFTSWVPLGTIFMTYSAPTTAISHALPLRLMVEKKT